MVFPFPKPPCSPPGTAPGSHCQPVPCPGRAPQQHVPGHICKLTHFKLTWASSPLASQEEFCQPPARPIFFNNIRWAGRRGANCFLSKQIVSPSATSAFSGGRNTIHYQGMRYMCTKGIYSQEVKDITQRKAALQGYPVN